MDRLTQIQSVLEVEYVVTEEKYLDMARGLVENEHILLIDDLKLHDIEEKRLDIIRSRVIDTDILYANFTSGSTLVIIPRSLFSKLVELLDFICDHKVSVMTWAVSALCLINAFHGLDYRVPDTVKKVLFSGEVMPHKHLRAILNIPVILENF